MRHKELEGISHFLDIVKEAQNNFGTSLEKTERENFQAFLSLYTVFRLSVN